jgi:hypothetical protein
LTAYAYVNPRFPRPRGGPKVNLNVSSRIKIFQYETRARGQSSICCISLLTSRT